MFITLIAIHTNDTAAERYRRFLKQNDFKILRQGVYQRRIGETVNALEVILESIQKKKPEGSSILFTIHDKEFTAL